MEALNAHINELMNEQGCPTEEQLLKYWFKLLSAEEARKVELHLAHCSVCNDLLEGMMQIESMEEASRISNELKQKIQETYHSRRKNGWIYFTGIAASVLVLVGLFFLFFQKPIQEKEYLAQEPKVIQAAPENTAAENKAETPEQPRPVVSREKAKNQEKPAPKKKNTLVVLVEKQDKKGLAQVQDKASPQKIVVAKSEKISDSSVFSEPSFSSTIQPLSIEVSGMVIDGETGEPIPGATITVMGQNRGTLTKVDGSFKLAVFDPEAKFTVSYVGFKNKEIELSDLKAPIKLEQENLALNEVVAPPAGSSRETRSVGYVAQMSESPVAKKTQKEDSVLNEINRENFSEAIDLLTERINQNPEDTKSMEMLAYCYLQTNDSAKAIALLDRVIAYNENKNFKFENEDLTRIVELIQTNQFKKAGKLLRKRF